MLLLIYYTATTLTGPLQGNSTRTGNCPSTPEDIEKLRDDLTAGLKSDGIEISGSGNVVIANIMNIDKLGV